VKAVQPAAVSISQVTESGTLYSLAEIAGIGEVARRHDLGFHLDGARFANALVSLGCTPAEMTWKAGVDIVSFGATKNGCFACEAVIFFDPARAERFGFRRKRSGHTVSKGRLLGAQMSAYLRNNHWLENARHANAMAKRLSEALGGLPGVRLPCSLRRMKCLPFFRSDSKSALGCRRSGRALVRAEHQPAAGREDWQRSRVLAVCDEL